MKATELQIDDYLYILLDNGDSTVKETHRITSMMCDGDEPYIQTDLTDTYYDIRSYELIPLTADILKNNGFEPGMPNADTSFIYTDEETDESVCIDMVTNDDGNTCFAVNIVNKKSHLDCNADIMYVHQLQQLFRFMKITKNILL